MDLGVLMARVDAVVHPDWPTITSIVIVVLLAVVALRLLGIAVRGIALGVLQRDKEPVRELTQKAKTLSQVVETTGRIVILTIAGLTLLSLIGKDVTPLLASAGIAGIAVGFGAQNLIKDWLGGFFILLENQYSVDDVIKVGEHSGVVEKLDLRRTVLRNADGAAIVIPNGEVRVVTNLTKEWSRAIVDVNVPYEEDLDRVLGALEDLAEELSRDEQMAKLILEPLEVLGVESLGQHSVTIRISAKTHPAKQWAVARVLRVRVKKMFDREGIGIPYPRQIAVSQAYPAGPAPVAASPLVAQRDSPE